MQFRSNLFKNLMSGKCKISCLKLKSHFFQALLYIMRVHVSCIAGTDGNKHLSFHTQLTEIKTQLPFVHTHTHDKAPYLPKKHVTVWKNTWIQRIRTKNRSTARSLIMNAPCCIIYSTILFDLDMMGQTSWSWRRQNTLSLGHRIAKKDQVLLVDHESKKKKRS